MHAGNRLHGLRSSHHAAVATTAATAALAAAAAAAAAAARAEPDIISTLCTACRRSGLR